MKDARTVSLGDAVVLVTSGTPGVRDCGTGFCIACHQDAATIVTCAHVVRDLAPNQERLRVNGRDAMVVPTLNDNGADLAVIRVPGFTASPLQLSAGAPSPGAPVQGAGFVHLHGAQYVSTALAGTVAEVLTMREQLSLVAIPSLRLDARPGTAFAPGNSGSPLCDASGGVLGMLAYASHDGRSGYALSGSAIIDCLSLWGIALPEGSAQSPASVTDRPPPPELPRVRVPDDLQKGRFGGQSSDGAVALEAQYLTHSGTSFFACDVTVRAILPGLTLVPPARFYLHDTFPKSIVHVRRADDDGALTLRSIHSYGVFTVGCHVFASDGAWHSVELDLATLLGLPDVFRTR